MGMKSHCCSQKNSDPEITKKKGIKNKDPRHMMNKRLTQTKNASGEDIKTYYLSTFGNEPGIDDDETNFPAHLTSE